MPRLLRNPFGSQGDDSNYSETRLTASSPSTATPKLISWPVVAGCLPSKSAVKPSGSPARYASRIAGVFCGLLLLLQSPVHCLYFETYFIILQQFDGNILGPKIIGNTTGLSGFWVLFSILLFGGLWGVAGMVVGIPLFAVIYDIVRRLVDWGLRRRGQDDLFQEYRARFPENSPSALDFNEDDLKEPEPAA